MIYVYTGDGKGKTTAALGTALRALGYGYRVVMIQFLKGQNSGEMMIKGKIPNFEIHQFGQEEFVDPEDPNKESINLAKRGIKFAKKILEEEPFLLILDEINVAVDFAFLDVEEVLNVLDAKSPTHIILTGRNVPEEVKKRADLVTEMEEVKHPYNKNRDAIKGLDY